MTMETKIFAWGDTGSRTLPIGITSGCNGLITTGCYYVPAKGPKVPQRDPIPCPKCGNRAITDSCGNDSILELNDHQKDAEGDFEPNGIKARIRVCANCSHLWATVVRPVEQ